MIVRFLAGLLVIAAAAGPAAATTLMVRADGIRSSEGDVYVAVCAGGFDEAQCPYKDRERAAPGAVGFRIAGVKPGRYALAVYHDQNGNGRLDRIAFVPTEPYGFSNGIGRTRPPTFAGAAFQVEGASMSVAVSVR